MDGMEILVFIAIMGLLLYQKSTRKQSKDKKPRQKRPAHPVVLEEEEEEEVPETVVPIEKPAMSRPDSLYEATLERKPFPPVSEQKGKVTTRVSPIKRSSDGRIRFRTREDARRAFLYSEIFNRKYD